MPPPLLASATFSFQVPTMPSSESDTSLRKQEIGRPRLVPPLDRIGRRRHEPQPAHIVVQPLGVAARRRHRRRRRGRTCPGSFRPASDSGRSGSPCRTGSAARRAHGPASGRTAWAAAPADRAAAAGRVAATRSCSRSGCAATGLATGAGLVSTVRVTTTERSITRSGGVCTTTWPSVSKSPSRTCLPSADIAIPLCPSGESEAIAAADYRCLTAPRDAPPQKSQIPFAAGLLARGPFSVRLPGAIFEGSSGIWPENQPFTVAGAAPVSAPPGRSEVPLNPLSRAFE